ncbi:uncharacterized protein METZ01_LOCUS280229 [marine metagenome]|uniref:Uncharacterized protein n=1 Tax=marine metagenome TaxID=408172 RepID=A0A382KUZ1_9ZZZZ
MYELKKVTKLMVKNLNQLIIHSTNIDSL